MIIEQILVTNFAVFCYLIADENTREGILIDPAGDVEIISKVIEKHNVNIKWIVNTHGHFDHTGGNDYFMKKTGAGLLVHEEDAPLIESVKGKITSLYTGKKSYPEVVAFVKDGDIIELGSIKLKVLHTPGHSGGCICLYTEGNIFTGDTLFTEGMGRTDLRGGSERVIMNSIRNIILKLPDDTVVWPGHHYGRNPKSTVREQKRYYM
jgi:hydroxyacylglutathione hydrolase